MTKKNKHLICIVGPTASGKTSIGIELAKELDTEILSADSRQMYREMMIGTAKPTAAELSSAKHHFVDNLSLTEPYSAGDYERQGLDLLSTLFSTKDDVLVVGGSGLFVKALTDGFDDIPKVPQSLREELNSELITNGIIPLQEKLKDLDPVQFQNMDTNNPQRVIRALEVCIGTGKPYSSFKGKNKASRNFDVITIGLDWDRPLLYERINYRVDQMIKAGLEQEVKSLLAHQEHPAFNTVGYQEFLPYFNSKCTIDEVIEKIKTNTRRYAKRQLTWFRKTDGIIWVKPEVASVLEAIKTQTNA